MKTTKLVAAILVSMATAACVGEAPPDAGRTGSPTNDGDGDGPADDPNDPGTPPGPGGPDDPTPPGACTTAPDGLACFCETMPQDEFCVYCAANPTAADCADDGGGQCDPNDPACQGGGEDPCQTDPQGDACYCQQTPQDPYCQQMGDPNQGGDPCTTDPNGDACYCQEVPQDPYCQQ